MNNNGTFSMRARKVYRWLTGALLLAFLPITALAGDTVTANGHVYLRAQPSTEAEIVLVLEPNAPLAVNAQAGDWFAVTYGRKTGYVRQDVVTMEGGELLREGSQGEAVRTLQTALQNEGFYKGSITGNFGSLTKEAVRLFQKRNGLDSDGVAGKKTQDLLYGRAEAGTTAKDGQTQQSEAADSASAADGLLKQGAQGDTVRQLQTRLESLGFYKGSVTGDYGPLTEDAVRAFQRKNNLSADGIAGAKTLQALNGNGANGAGNAGGFDTNAGNGGAPNPADVINANFLTTIRPKYKAGTDVTVYDFSTGLSWKCRCLTSDMHTDGEPLTSTDTDTMYRAFGNKNTWTPKAVWYTMPDGKTYIGSIHNMGHGSDRISGNNFTGVLCMHFPRTMKSAEETGTYAATHQRAILAGWEKTQQMAGLL